MPQYSLSLPDRDPIVFHGDLLVRVESARDVAGDGERGYDLSVYSRDDGGYVAAIDFVTTVPLEENRGLIELVDTIADVEDFFFAFEPDELLPDLSRSGRTASDRQNVLQRLYAKYDQRVKDVLDQLRSQQPTRTSAAK